MWYQCNGTNEIDILTLRYVCYKKKFKDFLLFVCVSLHNTSKKGRTLQMDITLLKQ